MGDGSHVQLDSDLFAYSGQTLVCAFSGLWPLELSRSGYHSILTTSSKFLSKCLPLYSRAVNGIGPDPSKHELSGENYSLVLRSGPQ
jgi:hypothetical protein